MDPRYKPAQRDAIHKLLAKLNDLAEIFLGCLRQQQQKPDSGEGGERPERLARDVLSTHGVVAAALQSLMRAEEGDKFIENALALPLAEQYRALLESLRFDYMSMRDPKLSSAGSGAADYVHHYKASAAQNESPPASKMLRLAQELADLSNALPCEHTNSIYVRVDKERVDMMKALIVGSSNTPYAHGCYEFDIFCDNKYPNDSPKMNLMTTGGGSVRFNPNLYACGKVCLSLLGTWRGSATENWDPKLSTILQVLVSVQAIIMSEDVYFNEPGFENEAGTVEGEKKNEGYSNIVRYANVKFAMLGQLKSPPRGFESVVKRHFYVKRFEIVKEVNHWLELAGSHEAAYTGLIHDHNYTWCSQFKQSKTRYKEMLAEVVKQLEDALNKLDKPTDVSNVLGDVRAGKKRATQRQKKLESIAEGQAELEDIDVADDTQIDSSKKVEKEIDIEDEAVKDRWSRYIGAMGVEAVAKQAAASIFLSGAGALGVEIAKNLVLSGCKSFTLHDPKPVSKKDLSGQFFISQEQDFGDGKSAPLTRAQACLPRLQQLNHYVRCKQAADLALPADDEALAGAPWSLHLYDVVIMTDAGHATQRVVNQFCRKRGIKFISADCHGVFSRVFNDFGPQFEVLDKNGEELQDVMIQKIASEEAAVVELLQNQKHKFEDGDEVLLQGVEGMKLKAGEKHDDPLVKSDSINDTIHKVTVLTPYSFKIGDTRKFEPYERSGIAKQLKSKVQLQFRSFEEAVMCPAGDAPLDANLAVADFEKMATAQTSHLCFLALDKFRAEHKSLPATWDLADAKAFVGIAKSLALESKIGKDDLKDDSEMVRLFYLFAFQCQGVFNPLCAFVGGLAAQEGIKAITQKFSPAHQLFYYDATEVLPDFDVGKHVSSIKLDGEDEKQTPESVFAATYVQQIARTAERGDRSDGLRVVVG